MKKHFLYAIVLLAAVVTGCRKDNPDEDTTQTPVTFVIDKEVTRTVTSGNTTTFVEGDMIGISSSGLKTDMSNAQFSVKADGTLSGDAFWYNGKNAASFFAHYPYTASYSTGKVSMTVSADQTSAEKFNACDFMTASAEGDPTKGGLVSLKFHHRLTLVKVVWGGSLTAVKAELKGLLPTVTWAQAYNTLETSGTATDIAMWLTDKANQEYWALVPAQTVKSGSDLVVITDVDKEYKYVTESDVTFTANTVKKITLVIREDGSVEASISEIDIENWGNDSEEVGGKVDEVVIPPVALIPDGDIVLTANSKANAAAGAWNVAVEEGSTIEVVAEGDDAGAIHMNIGTDLKWWNNAVYYRPAEAVAAKIKPSVYKLTFEAKASVALKGFMVQVMKGDADGNVYFGILNTDPALTADVVTYNRMYYPSFKEEQVAAGYVKMTYWVDFSVVINADGSSVTEGAVGDYEKVLLTLSVNTGTSAANAYGVDFHFRNFEFTEVK